MFPPNDEQPEEQQATNQEPEPENNVQQDVQEEAQPPAAAASAPAQEGAAPAAEHEDLDVAMEEIIDAIIQNEPFAGNENADDAAPFYGFPDEDDAEPTYEDKDMGQVLQIWESKHTQVGFDPVPALKRLAEIFGKETEIYMRKDPDPFDERHPYRTDPSCQFGFLLKQLFRKDNFMTKLVNDYLRDTYFTRHNLQRSALELNILACRLILVIMPGLETSAVFQVEYDNLINRIYGWAEDSIEPLQSYATGLLAAAMEVTDIAVTFRELNTRLVPKMLKRLHMLQAIYKALLLSPVSETVNSANNSIDSEATASNSVECVRPNWMSASAPHSPQRAEERTAVNGTDVTHDSYANTSNISLLLDNSREAFGNKGRSARRMYIPIHPPTQETSQMLIMRYLTSMGEYQEFLGLIFEHKAMQLIFGYIENLNPRDTCLAFEALKYLASLLCHKKFALEFISHGGLELLLKVPRPSIAATGVSITLYYLAYSEDAMERICTMPRAVITDLVRYALWILGRSYDSGKCHATMFFGLSFQFKVILDEFDAQDGLRKLYNVISILKILNPPNNAEEEANNLNEDVECASRQLVRHVCVALKRYMEAHLFYKYNNFMRQQCPTSSEFSPNVTKATKANLEQISEQIRTLQENTSVRAHWAPVDNLLKLGGITLLLKAIALSFEWTNNGRAETVRSALDVLSICCVIPKVYVAFCERLDLPDTAQSGISSILGAASGDLMPDADVQKAGLATLCQCVCSPIARKEPNNVFKCFGSSSKKTKLNNKYSEDLVQKVWENVSSNNGIIVLLSLMQIKVPITDADCIRGMACRALAGLARSERVRQIISKLPLFANGQLQTLMRDPLLQEKRAEHVIFQKHALELLERISGKAKPINNQLDPSLANIHKANVVAQTKIQYNEQQLFQLIYEHLEGKGMTETAHTLIKEAGLQPPAATAKNFHQSPFDYKVLPPSTLVRNRIRTRMQDVMNSMHDIAATPPVVTNTNYSIAKTEDGNNSSTTITPIKLVKKLEKTNTITNAGCSSLNHQTPGIAAATANVSGCASTQRSLQKQISFDSSQPDDIAELPQTHNGITLSTIVTEYLTNQHALCNNPMTTCPQFDLFTPHKCPDPKPNRTLGTNLNLTSRLFRAQAGYNTARLDRRFVHTNFAPWRNIRSNDYNEVQFTCCDIVPQSNLIIVGTQQGEGKAFDMNDGSEQFSSIVHSYGVDSIQTSRRGDLVLTSCTWRSPLSVLWSIRNKEFNTELRFADEFYCEFSNLTQDKVIGTQNDCAVIYDIQSNNKIAEFKPNIPNQYTKNRATFCPTDELILSDGVLWDVRSGKEIHKFDKLNQSLSGVFHPNGLEIISNTEVWDLRTFHLLQTVPVLDQCLIKFSAMQVIYGLSLEIERSDFEETANYDTSFKVLDAYDYSSISTIDVKRNIHDLCVSRNGSLIALVENQPGYDSKQETYVKIYAVGMKKNEQQEEEDDEEPESEEDGTDSDATDVFDISANGNNLSANNRLEMRNLEGVINGSDSDSDIDSDEDDDSDDDDDDDDDNDGWVTMRSPTFEPESDDDGHWLQEVIRNL